MKTGIVFGLLTLAMILGSCESLPPVGGEPSENVAPEIRPLPLADVPEPRGFSRYESEQNSFSFIEGPYRQAELHYRGSSSNTDVAAFYEGQMPIHGWTRVDREQSKGRRVLVYEKTVPTALYRTRVTIAEKPGWTELEIRLDTVDTSPAPTGGTAAPEN